MLLVLYKCLTNHAALTLRNRKFKNAWGLLLTVMVGKQWARHLGTQQAYSCLDLDEFPGGFCFKNLYKESSVPSVGRQLLVAKQV